MKKILTLLFSLAFISGFSQGYFPAKHIAVNDAIAPAQKIPVDARQQYYDTSLFLYRDFQSTSEVLATYPTGSQYRYGHPLYYIHSGGMLSFGVWIGGTAQIWSFLNGVADSQLVQINTGFTSVPQNLVDTVYRVNDSTVGYKQLNGNVGSFLIRGTAAGGISSLSLSTPTSLFVSPVTFTNTGGAWAGTLATANQSAGTFFAAPATGGLGQPGFRSMVVSDLPTGIPNGNLANSSISLVMDNTGTAPGFSASSVALGGTITFHNPWASATTSGPLQASDWIRFNSAVTASVISVNGQTGVVVTKNADSLMSYPIDFTNFHAGWVLSVSSDSTKLVFDAPGSGSGIVNLNGLTTTTQSFAIGTSGTSPGWNSATATHTLNIPILNGADSGIATPAMYNSWNSKQAALSGTGYLSFSGITPTYTNGSSTNLMGYNASGGVSAIILGTNLSMTGNTLNATGGGTPGGSNTQVQFNNSGAFGGSANLTWNGSALAITGALSASGTVNFTGITSGTSNDSVLTINSSTGKLGWTSRNFTLYAVNGMGPIGTHGDSLQRGGILGAFFQNDSDYYANNSWFIYNLNASFSSLVAGDSVMVHGSNGQVKFLPSSAIGGGGGGAVSSVSNSDATLTIAPTTGAVVASLNLSNANTWVPAQSFTGGLNTGGSILFTGTTGTLNVGSLTHVADIVYSRNFISDGDAGFATGNAANFGFNLSKSGTPWTALKGNSLSGDWYLTRGATQVDDAVSLWHVNGRITGDSIVVLNNMKGGGGTPQIVVHMPDSSLAQVALGTNLSISGGVLNASGSGGSLTINGTSGSVTGSTLTFAQSTNVSNTALTMIGSGTTLTFTNNPAVDYGDNSRPSNLNMFWGSLVGNITLTGQHNTGLGYQVMQNITSGNYNTGMGVQSLNALTTGSQNTMYGWVTGFNITTGSNNTFLGTGAGSGDTIGSNNTYVGQIAGDLNGQGNYNTAVGTQAMGAENGAPYRNTIIGAYNTSSWGGTDTLVTSVGAWSDQPNLANRKQVDEFGAQLNSTFSTGYVNSMLFGDNISAGNARALYRNVTAFGQGLILWKDSVAMFATNRQIVMLTDSGGTTSAQATLQHVGGGIWYNRDSTATGSGYVVYVPGLGWSNLITTAQLAGFSGGFANPMTTAGDLILGGTSGTPTRLGIGANTYVLTSNGTTASWQPASGGGSPALSSITSATATNFIDNTTFKQRWSWTGLAGDTAFSLVQNTTAATNAQVGFSELLEGTNASSGITTIAAFIQNAHTGTTAVNIGLEISSSGAPINYGLVIPNTSVLNGFGTATPASTIDMEGSSSTELTIGSSVSTATPNILFKASSTLGELYAVGSTYPSAAYNTGFTAASLYLRGSGAGGISIAGQGGNSPIRFFTGGEGLANLHGILDSIGRWHFDTVTSKSFFEMVATRSDNNPGLEGFTFTSGKGVFTDNTSTTTVSMIAQNTFFGAGIAAFHSGVTYTNAANIYIDSAVSAAGANATITNPWSIYVNTGKSHFGGALQIVDGTQGASKVLTSDASGNASWQTPSGGSTPTLQQVLTAGSTLTTGATISQAGNPFSFSGGIVNVGAFGTTTWNPGNTLAGSLFSVETGTLNDAATSASGTVANAYVTGISTPSLTATNTGVVYTNAYTFFVNGAPVASTHVAITNSYSFGVQGNALFQANALFQGSVTAGSVNLTGNADLTAQTGAVTVTSYAVPGSTTFNTFRVGGYITVTAVSLDVIQLKVTWTDETSTSRSQSFFVQGATTGIGATGANAYSPIDIRVLDGTTITVATVLTTGTGSITYDVGANITKLY